MTAPIHNQLGSIPLPQHDSGAINEANYHPLNGLVQHQQLAPCKPQTPQQQQQTQKFLPVLQAQHQQHQQQQTTVQQAEQQLAPNASGNDQFAIVTAQQQESRHEWQETPHRLAPEADASNASHWSAVDLVLPKARHPGIVAPPLRLDEVAQLVLLLPAKQPPCPQSAATLKRSNANQQQWRFLSPPPPPPPLPCL